MRLVLLSLVGLGLGACAGPRTSPAPVPPPSARPAADGAQPSEDAESSSESVGQEGSTGPNPLLDDRQPDERHALPRLNVKHVGLHVGGGTGTAEERKGLLDALEARQVRLMECYRLVDRPEAGGTFGVDLYVSARGGRPEVRALRHKLGGEGFESCMMSALTTVEFASQARPIVVSYSMRFELSP